MRFDIATHRGAGSVLFGMSPNDARSQLSAPFKSFKRTPQSAYPCDFFPSFGVFFYYSADGLLEAIEFSSPSRPHFNGADLLGVGFRDLATLLASSDPNLDVRADGLTSKASGIGAYAPDASDAPQEAAESVIAFSASYYD